MKGKAGFIDFYGEKIKSRTTIPCPEGYQDPVLGPGLGKVSVSECLVAGPLSIESSQAQPKKETLVCPHVGQPPTGGATKV